MHILYFCTRDMYVVICRCYCGRIKRQHSKEAQNAEDSETGPKMDPRGMLRELIHEFPTDAYGEIQFGQAEGISNKAKVCMNVYMY